MSLKDSLWYRTQRMCCRYCVEFNPHCFCERIARIDGRDLAAVSPMSVCNAYQEKRDESPRT